MPCDRCGSPHHNVSKCPWPAGGKLSPSTLRAPAYPVSPVSSSRGVRVLLPGSKGSGFFYGGDGSHHCTVGDEPTTRKPAHVGDVIARVTHQMSVMAKKAPEARESLAATVLREVDPIGALFAALARRVG